MSSVVEIEDAITSLTDRDLQELSAWFTSYISNKWDDQMAEDALSGALDFLGRDAEQARTAF